MENINVPEDIRLLVKTVPFKNVFDIWKLIEEEFGQLGQRWLCLNDRYYLLVRMMKRIDMVHPWLYERCREVEAEPDGYLDLWSREHYKSTIGNYGGVIQEILKNPDLTVGIFSHTKPIAKAFLKQIKTEFETNEDLKECFPDILYSNPEKDSPSWSLDAGIIVIRKSNPKESTIEAHGLVDGQPTSKHFGLLVYDDVVTRESVGTPEQIKKTTEAWELSDNLGSIGGRKWMFGTRYSYADTYEEIMKRGAAKVRIYPATHDGTMNGRPVLWPQEVWEQKKIAQGEATVCCQLLQNPLAGQQRMFDVTDICTYEIRPATLSIYIMVDPARSKKTDSDNTAIVVIGVDYNVNKYLLDGFNHKMDLQERWQSTSLMYKRWKKMPGVQSVKVGYESYGAQADLDYFKERQRVENLRFEIEELAWPHEGGGSKVDRVQRLGPDMRSHKIFLPHETDVNNYTSMQRNMVAEGYSFRVAQPIKRKDSEGRIYNLTDDMKLQFHYFPFGGKKDLVDAFSRIYDMNPMAPSYNEPSYLEPDYV